MRPTRWELLSFILGFGGLALLPLGFGGHSYVFTIGFSALLYVALSLSWNILGGFGGQLSFGFAAFYGLGAYSTAFLVKAGWPLFPSYLIGGLIASVFSVLIGYPCFRLRGPYFLIATIGVAEAVRVIALNWESVSGGAMGISLPMIGTASRLPDYYSALFLAAVVLIVSYLIRESKFGLSLFAVKMDLDAAESLGVNSISKKILAHLVAAFFVGIAGGLYAKYALFIEPETVFGFHVSITMVLMPVVGGMGTLLGPVLGAVFFSIVQEELLVIFPTVHLLLYGLLLMVVVLFEPKGFVGLLQRAKIIRPQPFQ